MTRILHRSTQWTLLSVLLSNRVSDMPFSEVSNALLITYIATEYSIASSSKSGFSCRSFLTSRANQVFFGLVILINVVDRLVGAALLVNGVFENLLHAPKILLAALLYTVVLYVDCARLVGKPLTLQRFATRVGMEFLKILPLYPFLAVLISCGFMFVISFCEHLHLPLDWLNWPIYYGTLYGPFSVVYFQVKSKLIVEEMYFIPHTTTVLPPDFFQSMTTPQSLDHVRDLRVTHFSTRQ